MRIPRLHFWLKIFAVLIFQSFIISKISGQTFLPLNNLPLDNLNSFKPATSNWIIAGNISSDISNLQFTKTAKGTGILANIPNKENNHDLLTNFEHGDLELEIDFLIPKGSNSGIYFQGRYEIQIIDSWDQNAPSAGGCGAIYERWNDSKPEGQKGYEGHPPRYNVCRAPGLWQNYKISFQAPRFNQKGEKIANAKFLKVLLNGVLIHEDIELTGPTRGPISEQESPMGPLRIQGDHGPVAFRNIKYKKFNPELQVRLENMSFSAYEGKYDTLPDFDKLAPKKSGKTNELTWLVSDSPNDLALKFTGNMVIPQTGEYLFTSESHGEGRLEIDGRKVTEHYGWYDPGGKVKLEKGSHPFTFYFSRSGYSWIPTLMGLFVEGPEIQRQPLHAESSMFSPSSGVGGLTTIHETEPFVLRSFTKYKDKVKPQSISVFDPGNIYYSVDLNSGALLQIWKGDFVDIGTIWGGRGGFPVKPLGSKIFLEDKPVVAMLENEKTQWPDSVNYETDYIFKNYELDNSRRPTFSYTYKGLMINDKIVPENNSKILTREIKLNSSDNSSKWYYRIASGTNIELLSDGTYSMNDKEYYIKVLDTGGAKVLVREMNNTKELLIPVKFNEKQNKLRYSIIW